MKHARLCDCGNPTFELVGNIANQRSKEFADACLTCLKLDGNTPYRYEILRELSIAGTLTIREIQDLIPQARYRSLYRLMNDLVNTGRVRKLYEEFTEPGKAKGRLGLPDDRIYEFGSIRVLYVLASQKRARRRAA